MAPAAASRLHPCVRPGAAGSFPGASTGRFPGAAAFPSSTRLPRLPQEYPSRSSGSLPGRSQRSRGRSSARPQTPKYSLLPLLSVSLRKCWRECCSLHPTLGQGGARGCWSWDWGSGSMEKPQKLLVHSQAGAVLLPLRLGACAWRGFRGRARRVQ